MELLKYVSKYHFVEPGEMQHKEKEVQIDHKDLKENMNKSCPLVAPVCRGGRRRGAWIVRGRSRKEY